MLKNKDRNSLPASNEVQETTLTEILSEFFSCNEVERTNKLLWQMLSQTISHPNFEDWGIDQRADLMYAYEQITYLLINLEKQMPYLEMYKKHESIEKYLKTHKSA